MKSLKRTCAEALAWSSLVLPADATRDLFEAYVSETWDEDTSTFDEWTTLVSDMAIFDRTKANDFIRKMCEALDQRYPWLIMGHNTGYELWCFCIARWVRNNDLDGIHKLPMMLKADHRHAYAMSGGRHNVLQLYSLLTQMQLPLDWLDTLVRPEMWYNELFVVSALLEPDAKRRAGNLAKCVRVAAGWDNHQAVHTIVDVADADQGCGTRFWHLVDAGGTFKDIMGSYRRLHESVSRK